MAGYIIIPFWSWWYDHRDKPWQLVISPDSQNRFNNTRFLSGIMSALQASGVSLVSKVPKKTPSVSLNWKAAGSMFDRSDHSHSVAAVRALREAIISDLKLCEDRFKSRCNAVPRIGILNRQKSRKLLGVDQLVLQLEQQLKGNVF
jgi:hypothetical protein